MAPEFCEHLAAYAARYGRANRAYEELTAQIDLVRGEGPSDDALDRLEVNVRAWQEEVKKLRTLLVSLVRGGAVDLPAGDGEPADRPCCAVCRQPVPRLDWPEWRLDGERGATYRGQSLPQAAQLPA